MSNQQDINNNKNRKISGDFPIEQQKLNQNVALIDNQWYRFDDGYVTPFNVDNIKEECFGGDVNGNNNTTDRTNNYNLLDGWDTYKSKNAYILFYERVTKIYPPQPTTTAVTPPSQQSQLNSTIVEK